MASNLGEEHERYTQLVDKLEQGSASEASKAALDEGKAMLASYGKDLTISETLGSLKTWKADTPEEIETIELCLKVRDQAAYKEESDHLRGHRTNDCLLLELYFLP